MLVIRGGNISCQSRQQKSTHVGGTRSIRGNNEHQEPDTPNDELGGENANDVSRALDKTRGANRGTPMPIENEPAAGNVGRIKTETTAGGRRKANFNRLQAFDMGRNSNPDRLRQGTQQQHKKTMQVDAC
ncbi:Hypothetical predicted protein [Olea europaea subsp. europaea]|uniref:Uncharacterized protein n=1 Tax=Olea europaea subsp. europaea TaxID=158383 RepID=A0A8S0PJL8_OLEEU|nr:Hypothetical predicted protein [Olea europaea subsp. europaea]CAA3020146.1 Hypothetical predicted protein [Olea europaea subsp. europaea]